MTQLLSQAWFAGYSYTSSQNLTWVWQQNAAMNPGRSSCSYNGLLTPEVIWQTRWAALHGQFSFHDVDLCCPLACQTLAVECLSGLLMLWTTRTMLACYQKVLYYTMQAWSAMLGLRIVANLNSVANANKCRSFYPASHRAMVAIARRVNIGRFCKCLSSAYSVLELLGNCSALLGGKGTNVCCWAWHLPQSAWIKQLDNPVRLTFCCQGSWICLLNCKV